MQRRCEGERRDSNPRPPGPQPAPNSAASIWLYRAKASRLDQPRFAQIGTTVGTTNSYFQQDADNAAYRFHAKARFLDRCAEARQMCRFMGNQHSAGLPSWLGRALSLGAVCGTRVTAIRPAARQYHFPRANPPKAISPTSATMSPIQKLQTIIRTIPTMTMIPPTVIPPTAP